MDNLYKIKVKKDMEISGKQKDLRKKNGREVGKLLGLNIALEDNISTKNIRTEVGSKMLKDYIPPFNATVVDRLLNEDANIKGKIETREFGVGKDIDSNMGRVVKSGDVDASIGVDVSGEIRNIATSNGLYGFKPSYGRISRYGIIGSGPSLEAVGVISDDIEKIELIFDSVSGKDIKDSGSIGEVEIGLEDARDMKIAVIKEYVDNLNSHMQKEFERIIESLKTFGIQVEYVGVPSLKYAPSVFNIIQSGEFSSNMGKFDGILYGYRTKKYKNQEDFFKKNRTEGFSTEVKEKILFGNFVLGEANYKDYYEKSQRLRTLINKEVESIFEDYNIILSPILGMDTKYTIMSNLLGTPSISFPKYKSNNLGIQIIGDKLHEDALFEMAKFYDKNVVKSGGVEGNE